MNETPDVQAVTRKLFSHGTIWIDTTALLPVFAEQLEPVDSNKKFSKIYKACIHAGMKLRVTSGVIREIEAHMYKSLTCARRKPNEWRGRIPFLYCQYLSTGQPPSSFNHWLELFRGQEQPEEDIAQYLNEVLGIERHDLATPLQAVNEDIRWSVERLWEKAHKERRRGADIDEEVTRQLVKHDVETYLGVVSLRQQEQVSELGYQHWLLTLDNLAWDIRNILRDEFPNGTISSPLLSLSFLTNNLTFGPDRSNTDKTEQISLPLLLDIEMSESLASDILQIANTIREENEGRPEYLIRRRVRDAINLAKRRRGCCDAIREQ